MARYTERTCLRCRRVGDKLMLKGVRCLTAKCAVERKKPPGGPGRGGRPGKGGGRPGKGGGRPGKVSDRGVQLLEKQRVRFTYGVMERQFRRSFVEAKRNPAATGEMLLVLMERRLDNVVYRLGFATSRPQARQLVSHGHIFLNGRRTDTSSCWVKPGDTIQWREGSTKTEYYKMLAEQVSGFTPPQWLTLDKEKMAGKVIGLPTRGDIDARFKENTIVEFYSR
ncbi:MAG: 30S ribosomal protein S4 [Chloroflexota bacterium]